MKLNFFFIISCTLLICLFSSCDKSNFQESEKYTFLIDSIYDITQTSATIKATLFITQAGKKEITGLSVSISKMAPYEPDTLYQNKFFNKSEGTVYLTINELEPNTLYYATPTVNFTPKNQYDSSTTSMANPRTALSFTTK